MSIRGQMEYRATFLMQSVGQFIINVIDFLALWALFSRFDSLRGWSLAEVAMLYGMAHMEWSIADALGRGFDIFGTTVKSGDFDRLLVRPRSTVLQLAGHELTLRRIGRFLQGLVVLVWAATVLDVAWNPAKIALFGIAIAGGACLFYGILILQATLCFWTTETLEVMNAFTYGGVEMARYPLVIYPRWFRNLFTFVLPLVCATYFPALVILGREDPLGFPIWFRWCAPCLGPMFLAMALQVWKVGVRRYCSTGS